MRTGQGTFEPSAALPVVLPPEQDELISSWLSRIARFYGRPLLALFDRGGRRVTRLDLSGIDLGTSRKLLAAVADLLGVEMHVIMGRTIAAAYPWATDLVALMPAPADGRRTPGLQYAACPHCLETQRIEKGFSWLRRDWLFAPRTVCSLHGVRLAAVPAGAAVHPIWTDFDRHHAATARWVRAELGAGVGEVVRAGAPPASLLRRMTTIQDAALALASAGEGTSTSLARMADDLLWAFTRRDHMYGDRLVHEAVAKDWLGNARRRRPGPVDYRHLGLDERHGMYLTATLLVGSLDLLLQGRPQHAHLKAELDLLRRRLAPQDGAALTERMRRWPVSTADCQ